MRMAAPDIVLFIVGLLLFGGATAAIVNEGALGTTGSATGAFNVAYEVASVELGDHPVSDMRSATTDFEIAEANVAAVHVMVQCSDAAGAAVPFQVQVLVTGPNGLGGEGSGACGSEIMVEIPVATPPEGGAVLGDTEDEARENLPALDNATAAQGTWSVEVSGGRSGAPPVGLPVGNPSGTIVFAIDQWEPRFTPVSR